MFEIDQGMVMFFVVLLAPFVCFFLALHMARKVKDTKVSRQEKLAKAAQKEFAKDLGTAFDVLVGNKAYDYAPVLKICCWLNQYGIGQWQRHEYDIKGSITAAAMRTYSRTTCEETVKEVKEALLRCRTEEELDGLSEYESTLVYSFCVAWKMIIQEQEPDK